MKIGFWFSSDPHERGRKYRVTGVVKDGVFEAVEPDDFVIFDKTSRTYDLWAPGGEDGDVSLVEEFMDLGEALRALQHGEEM